VRAASAGAGRGATFVVELPVSIFRPAPSAIDRVHPAGRTPVDFRSEPTLAGVRILVVDDEPDTVETVRAILGACGAEVRTAASAREALDEVQRWHPDILLSDIGMPEEDGFSLIRRLRALPPDAGGRTPALALTAYARVEDRVKVLSAGFQMHVPKPVEPAELVAVVASLRAWRGMV
jgi:CheY-like chemotaxis protein